MNVFHCGHCDQVVFFENCSCVKCRRPLAYLSDRAEMGTLEPSTGDTWRVLSPGNEWQEYRLCLNYSRENICNWAVRIDDPNHYCRSCRLNRVIPNLSQPGTREAWARMEAAKRRLIYSLLSLRLALSDKSEDPQARSGVRLPCGPRPRHSWGNLRPDRAPERSDHHQRRRGRRCRARDASNTNCMNRTGRCWATSATRSAITSGIG